MANRDWITCPGFRLCAGVALLAQLLGGCGGKDRLSVAPVQGRVVYRGQGVPHSSVVFLPADEESAAAAKNLRPFADTDDAGYFQLKTYVSGDGVPPGKYRVSIITPSGDAPVGSREDRDGMDVAQPTSGLNIPRSLRQKYADAETSGITVTIRPGENQLEPFVLE